MSRSSFIHRRGRLVYPDEVIADSPIVYWRLDEPSGTTATDFTGNGHTGTYTPNTGTITYAASTPLNSDSVDTSIAVNGNPYVISGTSTAWDTTSMTVEAWIHPTSGQSVKHGIAMIGGAGSGYRWYVRIQPTTGNVELFTGVAVGTTANVSFDVWTHLVVTFSASDSKWRVYQNGTVTFTTVGTSSLGAGTNRALTICKNNAGGAGSETLTGGIDEVAVYGTALSADRIATHYNAAF